MSTTTLHVPGIHCGHCKGAIEGALAGVDGVRSAEVSVEDRTVTVDYDEAAIELRTIEDAIVEQGYELTA
jgi:copper chaperone